MIPGLGGYGRNLYPEQHCKFQARVSYRVSPVSFFFIAVKRHTTKAAYNRKHLIWGLLTVLESEFMTVMMGSIVIARQGEIAENLHFICKLE